eukprot:TRINITY_DN9649_c0_g1_i1.p1 TRINITY_DN9649_c0_g1~~TRINITY_DN9649_c0_g1_i1.p1  ORF type:complete len:443 (+),score=136.52 TRINITY_DN9649_c0_g1_i1:167-1495(+)
METLSKEKVAKLVAALEKVGTQAEADRTVSRHLRGVFMSTDGFHYLFECLLEGDSDNIGPWLGVISGFERMKQLSIPMEEPSYWFVMTAYNTLGKYEEVLKLFEEMKQRGIEPEAVYAVVIEAYAALEKHEEMREAYTKGREVGYEPHVVTLNTMIDAYARSGNLKEMMAMWKETKNVVGVDELSYYLVIDALRQKKHYPDCMALWDELKRNTTDPIGVNTPIGSVMIDVLQKVERRNDAKDLFDSMLKSGVEISPEAFHIMANMYDKKTESAELDRIVQEALKRKIPLSAVRQTPKPSGGLSTSAEKEKAIAKSKPKSNLNPVDFDAPIPEIPIDPANPPSQEFVDQKLDELKNLLDNYGSETQEGETDNLMQKLRDEFEVMEKMRSPKYAPESKAPRKAMTVVRRGMSLEPVKPKRKSKATSDWSLPYPSLRDSERRKQT